MKIELGSGFLATLTLIFVIAKILGYIDWSWWVVFLPIIISVGIAVSILLAIISFVIIIAIVEGFTD